MCRSAYRQGLVWKGNELRQSESMVKRKVSIDIFRTAIYTTLVNNVTENPVTERRIIMTQRTLSQKNLIAVNNREQMILDVAAG